MLLKIFVFIVSIPSIVLASSISISVKYSEAANTFVIMDCVSGWWDKTFCQDEGGAYQRYWIDRFGLSPEEQALLKKYDALRQQYYKGLGLPKDDIGPYKDVLFAKKSGMNEDQIAPAFYGSDNLDQAFKKLEKILAKDDFEFLRNFYSHFKPKYEVLLKDSEPFKTKVEDLNKKIRNKNYSSFFSKISKYYSVDENMNYVVLYNWYPPLDRDSAFPADKFLVFQQNPKKHIKTKDEDVIFHEIVHTISARQPQKQKEAISNAFLKSCPSVNDKIVGQYRGRILEEPLAVAIGQIEFLKEFFPERLKLDSKLYNNPWISSFAKLVHPIVKDELMKNLNFSEETGKKLGFLCNEFFQASSFMESAQK